MSFVALYTPWTSANMSVANNGGPIARQDVAIIQHTLQISHRIPAESWKIPTMEIVGAQNFIFALKCPQNGGF